MDTPDVLHVFVDEYGTPNYSKKDSNGYFFLCGVIMPYKEMDKAHSLLSTFKMKWFNESNFSLHFQEISKQTGRYRILTDQNKRNNFFVEYAELLEKIKFGIVGSFICLNKMTETYRWPSHPYLSSLQLIAERLIFYSKEYKVNKYKLIIEGRGKKENRRYQEAIENIKTLGYADDNLPSYLEKELRKMDLEVHFKNKKDVISGLEIADTLAYCIGSTQRKEFLGRKHWEKAELILKHIQGKFFKKDKSIGILPPTCRRMNILR